MKKMKKMMALALAMVMVLAMSVSVFAATSHSITIKNDNDAISINGKTYSAYKLFDSTQNSDKTAYAYYLSKSNQFYTTAAAKTIVEKYFTLTDIPGDSTKVSAVAKTGFDPRTFADEIESVLKNLAADYTSPAATNEQAVISLPDDEAGQGYYIVTGTAKASDQNTTAGKEEITSAVIVTNEDPNPVAKPKAGIPTLDKKITKVQEGTTEQTGAVLDAQGQAAVAKVGSTVSYEIDSIVPDMTGYTKYTFTIGDTITAGLDYVKTSFKIKYGDGTATEVTPTFKDSDKKFELTIPKATLDLYNAGTAITLTYDCTVNDSALSYDYENNTANLTYSRNPYDDTEKDTTPDKKTYVIDLNIDVDKVAENASGKKLDGAEFQLYRLNGTTEEYYKWDTTNKKVTWVTSGGDTFTTDATGKLTNQIQGLDKGEYYLKETKAPVGYNPLSAPVKVTITAAANGTGTTDSTQVTYTATADGANVKVDNGTVDLTSAQTAAQPVAVATIVNNSGTILPSTGGIGTTIFYVVGSILVVGAGVLLVTRRRMNAN
jgi:fimbrial isopeptide formation D2 family protein/LPXTG-motif cell wall-anchored protein